MVERCSKSELPEVSTVVTNYNSKSFRVLAIHNETNQPIRVSLYKTRQNLILCKSRCIREALRISEPIIVNPNETNTLLYNYNEGLSKSDFLNPRIKFLLVGQFVTNRRPLKSRYDCNDFYLLDNGLFWKDLSMVRLSRNDYGVLTLNSSLIFSGGSGIDDNKVNDRKLSLSSYTSDNEFVSFIYALFTNSTHDTPKNNKWMTQYSGVFVTAYKDIHGGLTSRNVWCCMSNGNYDNKKSVWTNAVECSRLCQTQDDRRTPDKPAFITISIFLHPQKHWREVLYPYNDLKREFHKSVQVQVLNSTSAGNQWRTAIYLPSVWDERANWTSKTLVQNLIAKALRKSSVKEINVSSIHDIRVYSIDTYEIHQQQASDGGNHFHLSAAFRFYKNGNDNRQNITTSEPTIWCIYVKVQEYLTITQLNELFQNTGLVVIHARYHAAKSKYVLIMKVVNSSKMLYLNDVDESLRLEFINSRCKYLSSYQVVSQVKVFKTREPFSVWQSRLNNDVLKIALKYIHYEGNTMTLYTTMPRDMKDYDKACMLASTHVFTLSVTKEKFATKYVTETMCKRYGDSRPSVRDMIEFTFKNAPTVSEIMDIHDKTTNKTFHCHRVTYDELTTDYSLVDYVDDGHIVLCRLFKNRLIVDPNLFTVDHPKLYFNNPDDEDNDDDF